MTSVRTTARQRLRDRRVLAVCLCLSALACLGAAPVSTQTGEDSTGKAADTGDVDAAIEAASDALWKNLARTDAKVKALGLGSTVGGGGESSGGGSTPSETGSDISAELRGDVPRSIRAAWAIQVAGGQIEIAVQQGRFKVQNDTTIPGGNLMTISYAVLWVLLLVFIGVLAVRERRLAAELDALEDELAGLDEG